MSLAVLLASAPLLLFLPFAAMLWSSKRGPVADNGHGGGVGGLVAVVRCLLLPNMPQWCTHGSPWRWAPVVDDRRWLAASLVTSRLLILSLSLCVGLRVQVLCFSVFDFA